MNDKVLQTLVSWKVTGGMNMSLIWEFLKLPKVWAKCLLSEESEFAILI